MIKTTLRFRASDDEPDKIAEFDELPSKGSTVKIADKFYIVKDLQHTLYAKFDFDMEKLILTESDYPIVFLEK